MLHLLDALTVVVGSITALGFGLWWPFFITTMTLSPDDRYAGFVARALLEAMTGPDDARAFHKRAVAVLRRSCFSVGVELPTTYGSASGYIDMVAWFRGGTVAIELDRRRPRAKSIEKLLSVNAFRMIVLRDARWQLGLPSGIHAMVCKTLAEVITL